MCCQAAAIVRIWEAEFCLEWETDRQHCLGLATDRVSEMATDRESATLLHDCLDSVETAPTLVTDLVSEIGQTLATAPVLGTDQVSVTVEILMTDETG